MASAGKIVLLKETGLTATTIGASKSLEIGQVRLIGVLETANSAAANFTLTIEHSPNKIDWFTLASVPNLVGNGASKIDISINTFPNVRANLVRNAGSGDVICSVYFDKEK